MKCTGTAAPDLHLGGVGLCQHGQAGTRSGRGGHGHGLDCSSARWITALAPAQPALYGPVLCSWNCRHRSEKLHRIGWPMTQGKGNKIPFLQVVPQVTPSLHWYQHRQFCLPLSAQVRIVPLVLFHFWVGLHCVGSFASLKIRAMWKKRNYVKHVGFPQTNCDVWQCGLT